MIRVIKGDITELPLDAIVNAANNHLWMGSGVAGAIKSKGGSIIEEEAVARGPVQVGQAVVTSAGALKARYVIHAAAMGQDLSTDEQKVRTATRNALLRAEEIGLASIAFPALGTGVGGLNFDTVSRVMVSEVRRHLALGSAIKEVVFAVFDGEGYSAFSGIAGRDQVVCLGDSITYGYPYGPEASWVRICSESLQLKMVNKGINGDTAGQMRRRLRSDALSFNPAYLVILVGINDAWVGVTFSEFKENVTTIIHEAFSNGACPVLGVTSPINVVGMGGFPQDDIDGLTGDLEAYRGWIRDYAVSESLPVIDFYTPLLDYKTSKANPAYFVDEGHPNEEGYRKLAENAKKVLYYIKKSIG